MGKGGAWAMLLPLFALYLYGHYSCQVWVAVDMPWHAHW